MTNRPRDKMILAGGCSFSNSYYQTSEMYKASPHLPGMIADVDQFKIRRSKKAQDEWDAKVHIPWKAWPDLIAEKIGWNCHNVSMSGIGNEEIVERVLGYCCNSLGGNSMSLLDFNKNSRPDMILIGLSEWTRFTSIFNEHISGSEILNYQSQGLYMRPMAIGSKRIIENHPFDDRNDADLWQVGRGGVRALDMVQLTGYSAKLGNLISTAVKNTLYAIINLIHYCELHNIELRITQILSPVWHAGHGHDQFNDWVDKKTLDAYSQHNALFSYISHKNMTKKNIKLAGFPFLDQITTGCDWTRVIRINNSNKGTKDWTDLVIPNDGHPSEEGQKQLAEYVYNAFVNFAEVQV